eukprot:CCRYP_019237-RH/>CCRYP_019237-RH protein AED:0.49 eAED:0.49 QI:0/-1/0/1/-1/0/1/0/34
MRRRTPAPSSRCPRPRHTQSCQTHRRIQQQQSSG